MHDGKVPLLLTTTNPIAALISDQPGQHLHFASHPDYKPYNIYNIPHLASTHTPKKVSAFVLEKEPEN